MRSISSCLSFISFISEQPITVYPWARRADSTYINIQISLSFQPHNIPSMSLSDGLHTAEVLAMFATDDRVESHHHSDLHVFSFHRLAPPSSVRKDLGHFLQRHAHGFRGRAAMTNRLDSGTALSTLT